MKRMSRDDIQSFINQYIEPFAGHLAALKIESKSITGFCWGMLSSCWQGKIPVTTVRTQDNNSGVIGINLDEIHHLWVYDPASKNIESSKPKHIRGKFYKFFIALNEGHAVLYIDRDNQYASVKNILDKIEGKGRENEEH